MKKWAVIILSYFLILNFLPSVSAGADTEGNPDVKIFVLSEKEVYEKEFAAEVQVVFYNQNFYNDKVFLSYHVLQEKEDGTTEVLQFENQRITLVLDESGTASVTLQVALEKQKEKGIYIEFDLVDENNAFWFSYEEAIDLETDTIEVFDRPAYKHIVRLGQAIRNEIGIFTINLIVFVGVIFVYAYVRKKKVFEW